LLDTPVADVSLRFEGKAVIAMMDLDVPESAMKSPRDIFCCSFFLGARNETRVSHWKAKRLYHGGRATNP
jgi:hypothetical protein